MVSGFRKCGIHPFNCNAIPTLENEFEMSDSEITPKEPAVIRNGDSPANAGSENMPEEQGNLGSDDGPGNTDLDDSVQNSSLIAALASTQTLSSPQHNFSDDQIELFEMRFKEGYIYVDSDYVA